MQDKDVIQLRVTDILGESISSRWKRNYVKTPAQRKIILSYQSRK